MILVLFRSDKIHFAATKSTLQRQNQLLSDETASCFCSCQTCSKSAVSKRVVKASVSVSCKPLSLAGSCLIFAACEHLSLRIKKEAVLSLQGGFLLPLQAARPPPALPPRRRTAYRSCSGKSCRCNVRHCSHTFVFFTAANWCALSGDSFSLFFFFFHHI